MSGDIILYKTSYVIVICSKIKSKKIDKKNIEINSQQYNNKEFKNKLLSDQIQKCDL